MTERALQEMSSEVGWGEAKVTEAGDVAIARGDRGLEWSTTHIARNVTSGEFAQKGVSLVSPLTCRQLLYSHAQASPEIAAILPREVDGSTTIFALTF